MLVAVCMHQEEKSFKRTLERRNGTQRFEFSRKTIPRLRSSDRKRPLTKLEASTRHDKNAFRGVTKRWPGRNNVLYMCTC